MVPAWQQWRFGSWQSSEPGVSPGHYAMPDTRAAMHIAVMGARIREAYQGGDLETVSRLGAYLGRGNFGEVFRVDTSMGPWAVKLPVEANWHGVPYPVHQARRDFMHEAGNANQLARRGFSRLVPASIYVELHDGTPAIVREYGEPVTRVTLPEYAALEHDLIDVEERGGWLVHDALSLYRRPDGTLYVGDVGIWEPKPRGAPIRRTRKDSDVPVLLGEFARQAIPILQKVPVFSQLHSSMETLQSDMEDEDDFSAEMAFRYLSEGVRRRREFGLPVPKGVDAVLAEAQVFLEKHTSR